MEHWSGKADASLRLAASLWSIHVPETMRSAGLTKVSWLTVMTARSTPMRLRIMVCLVRARPVRCWRTVLMCSAHGLSCGRAVSKSRSGISLHCWCKRTCARLLRGIHRLMMLARAHPVHHHRLWRVCLLRTLVHHHRRSSSRTRIAA